MKRRVAITGVGLINALGIGREEYFAALIEGKNGIKRIEAFDPGEFTSQVAGESPHLKMAKQVPKAHRKATKLMSRDIELAVVAADTAVRDAGLKTKGTAPDEEPDVDPTRIGVNIGAGLICCDLVELAEAVQNGVSSGQFDYRKWGSEGMATLTPLWLLKYLPNMLSCHVSIIHDLQGPSNAVTCAEASGQLAVGEAYRIISHGKADVMITGGAECKVNPMALLRQCLLKRTCSSCNDKPDQACRPFDKGADGTILGEGGGIVVLEELEHARKRGATIYGEVTGYGASCSFGSDFVSIEADGKGIEIALRKALAAAEKAGLVDLRLRHLFQSAVRTGRRVREETGISKNALSVSSVAVDQASRIIGDLKNCKVLIIGAGEAGRLVVKAAKDRGVSRIVVTSRTEESASALAAELGGKPTSMNNLEEEMSTCNMIVTCADAPRSILDAGIVEEVMLNRPGLPMVIIDIAVPRNVAPAVAQINNVFLHNIDDLTNVANLNREQREGSVEVVREIIAAEVDKFTGWWQEFSVRPVISALMGKAEDIRRRELALTLKRLRPLSDEEHYSVDAMTRSIISKVLRDPITCLKKNASRDGDYSRMVNTLFGLHEESQG